MKCSILRHKFALLMIAALALASCSQDELADNGQDTSLPYGKYPLELTATIGEAVATPATRGTVHGTWPEGGFNLYSRVASSIDCPDENEIDWWNLKPEVQTTGYVINADGTVVWNTNYARPVYWRRTDEKIYFYAYSWACIPDERNTLIPHEILEDQSKDIRFEQSDYLFAYEVLTFGGDNTLNFRHLTSKITINLMRSDYLDAQDPEDVEVTLTGKNGGNWCIKGKFKGRKPNEITLVEDESREKSEIIPYKNPNSAADDIYATYEAILIPQTITGTGKTIQIKVGETTYSYEVKCSKGQYTSGEEWIYNITIDAKGLDVSVEENIGWGTDGATGSGSTTLPDYILKPEAGQSQKLKLNNGEVVNINGDGKPVRGKFEFEIPEGATATVNLNNVYIERYDSYQTAGFELSGGGTIIFNLNGTENTIEGFYGGGIIGRDVNVHIEGPGILNVKDMDSYGIAVQQNKDIKINRATLNIDYMKHTRVVPCACIGSQNNSKCGNITIIKSDVYIKCEATTMYDRFGAAIGCGGGNGSGTEGGVCGNIDITLPEGISKEEFLGKINVVKEDGSALLNDEQKIGRGLDGKSCGTITWRNSDGTEIK